jgi:hypothetical protein
MRVNRRGKRGIIMLYKMLETAINAREVNGLAEKIEKLFNADRLTESERNKLIERLANETSA